MAELCGTPLSCCDMVGGLTPIVTSSYVRLPDGDNGELRTAKRVSVVCGGTTPEAGVTSVNTQTGDVVLEADDVQALPWIVAATDNAIARWNGAGGNAVQNSNIIVADEGSVRFPGIATPAALAGKLAYDTTNECLTFFNNESDVSLQIGQEAWVRVRNVSGSTIVNGSAVYVNGADSGLPTIALAQANAAATTVCLGVTTHDIETNSTGYVTSIGVVRGLNTNSFVVGNIFLSEATPGALTQTAPSSPNYRYRVGFVTTVNATTGTIHVTPSTASIGAGIEGQRLIQGATGQTWGYSPSSMSILGAANAAWNAMPAASDFFAGARLRNVFLMDLTNYTQIRLVTTMAATAGVAGSKLNIKYKTGASTSNIANYAHIGTGGTEVGTLIDTINTQVASAWINLEAAAKADVQVAVCGEGGNGVVNPSFAMILIEVR